MKINSFCTSSYLALRYVAKDDEPWIQGINTKLPIDKVCKQHFVETTEEIGLKLKDLITSKKFKQPALFLSGGIDSAIIAKYMPKNTIAYHIKFSAEKTINELPMAKQYAKENNIILKIVEVSWEDYIDYIPLLMVRKKAPLHPIEPALYKAAKMAFDDGCDVIYVGNGADSTFGGMDKLLSKNWVFKEFYQRYTFIEPSEVLINSQNISDLVYESFRIKDNKIDYISFLKKIHGTGIVQSFENAIQAAGLSIEAPYEELKMKGSLDLNRIRNGEPKYLLFGLFYQLYPNFKGPEKIPFSRPTDVWLSSYNGPKSKIFKEDLNMEEFSGEQKFLIYCLDLFINILESWSEK